MLPLSHGRSLKPVLWAPRDITFSLLQGHIPPSPRISEEFGSQLSVPHSGHCTSHPWFSTRKWSDFSSWSSCPRHLSSGLAVVLHQGLLTLYPLPCHDCHMPSLHSLLPEQSGVDAEDMGREVGATGAHGDFLEEAVMV
jgi:hypothetical protein